MEIPPENTRLTPTLSGARIKLAPHPINPEQPGCLLPLLVEGALLVGLAGLWGLGLPGAREVAAVLGVISVALAWPVTGAFLVHLLGRFFGRENVRLTLTTATLVRVKPAREEIPLDDIVAAEAVRGRWALRPWSVAVRRRGGAREPVAVAMREDEARWLASTIQQAASRRRAALAAEGHTLETGAAEAVPAALRAVQAKTK